MRTRRHANVQTAGRPSAARATALSGALRATALPRAMGLFALVAIVCLGLACAEDTTLKVTGLSKNIGMPGDTLLIEGSGFQSGGTRGLRIYFGNTKANVKRFIGDRQILVEVPGIPGDEEGKTVDVQLIFEPGGAKKLANAFKYAEISQLTVEDFEDPPARK